MCNAIPKRCVVLNPCIAILDKALRLIYDGKYKNFHVYNYSFTVCTLFEHDVGNVVVMIVTNNIGTSCV